MVSDAKGSARGRWGRVLAFLALALVALVFVADYVSHSLVLPLTRSLIEHDLAEVVGLPVEIEDLHIELLPRPALEASAMRIANLPGRSAPYLVEVGELDIEVRWLPLLWGMVVVRGIEIGDVSIVVERDAEGRFELPLQLDQLMAETPGEEGDGVAFRAEELRAENIRVFSIGAHGDVTSLVIERLDVDGNDDPGSILFDARGSLDGSPFELGGRLGRLVEILEPTGPFPVDLKGRIFETTVSVRGSIADISRFEGFDLQIGMELSELDWAGIPKIDLGLIRLEGKLSDTDGTLGLEKLDVRTVEGEPFVGSVAGGIDDLVGLRDVSLALTLDAPDIDFLNPLFRVRLPQLDHAELSLDLTDADGSLGLSGDLRLEVLEGRGWLTLSGGYGDVTQLADLDVRFEAGARDPEVLSFLIPGFPELPPGIPSRVTGRIVGRGDVVGIEELDLFAGHDDAAWLSAKGRIEDLQGFRGVEIDVEYRVLSLPRLGELIGRELPDVGSVEGSAALYDRDGRLGIEKLVLESQGGSPIELQLNATLADLRELDEIVVATRLRAPDLEVVGELAGVELPALGPVDLSAHLSGSNERVFADEFSMQIGETHVRGEVEGSFREHERPSIIARVESPNLRLSDVGITLEVLRLLSASEKEPEPFEFEELRAVDLDLDLRIDRTTGVEGLDFRDLRALVRLDDGALAGDLGFTYRRGRVVGTVRVDARTPQPKLSTRFDATAVDIARLLAQLDLEQQFSGLLDLFVDVRSEGRDRDELLGALEGTVRIGIRDGTFLSSYARRFVLDLAAAVIPDFTVGDDDGDEPRIGCAVLEFSIEKGVATTRHLLLEEGEITITGAGTIDLVRGTYDLLLKPTTSNPGVVSVAPEVHVRGPLADPEFRSVRLTLATSLGRGLLTNLKRLGTLAVQPFVSRDEHISHGEATCARIGGPVETAAVSR